MTELENFTKFPLIDTDTSDKRPTFIEFEITGVETSAQHGHVGDNACDLILDFDGGEFYPTKNISGDYFPNIQEFPKDTIKGIWAWGPSATNYSTPIKYDNTNNIYKGWFVFRDAIDQDSCFRPAVRMKIELPYWGKEFIDLTDNQNGFHLPLSKISEKGSLRIAGNAAVVQGDLPAPIWDLRLVSIGAPLRFKKTK